MRILVLEPYFGGSHQFFVEMLAKRSRHTIIPETLPPRYWKWRLSGAPFLFARNFFERDPKPDLLLFTNTIDAAAFVALAGEAAAKLPKAIYFHENQVVYPLSDNDAPDVHYGLINITSAAIADRVWFNSDFHRRTFLDAIEPFLKQFPDFVPTFVPDAIGAKSDVLPLPVEPLPDVAPAKAKGPALRILWNHRWEYDKAPEAFFAALQRLAIEGVPYEVAILGEGFRSRPPIFDRSREALGDRVVRYGFADDRDEYAAWVRACDVVVSTARQEYFGVSVAEAVLAGCFPILPDRLVYPDIVPRQRRAEHLYRDETELVGLLRKAALNPNALRAAPKLPYYDDFVAEKVVARFDVEAERLARR